VRTGHGSIRRIFDRHGIRFRKNVLAGAQHRPAVAAARQRWRPKSSRDIPLIPWIHMPKPGSAPAGREGG
jgi:hypothetical protein